jgi:hypothetical protein
MASGPSARLAFFALRAGPATALGVKPIAALAIKSGPASSGRTSAGSGGLGEAVIVGDEA